MALEHMVWLTPKAGVSEDKMEEILASIRALTHLPGVLTISAGRNVTDRANGATHGVLVTLNEVEDLPLYLNHPDHQAVGVVLREHCEVLALDYEPSVVSARSRATTFRRKDEQQSVTGFVVIKPVARVDHHVACTQCGA